MLSTFAFNFNLRRYSVEVPSTGLFRTRVGRDTLVAQVGRCRLTSG